MKRTLLFAAPALVVLSASAASAQDLQPPAGEAAAGALPPTPPPPSEEKSDSGLGLEWVYINAGGGAAYTNMASLSESNLAVQKTSSSGGELDVGAGVRLLFLSLGVRARDLQLSSFNLWELNLEAELHMRIWHIDPYIGVRGGYVDVGSLDAGDITGGTNPGVAVHGFNVGPMFGIDFYITHLVSLGAEVNAELLLLERPPVPLPPGVTQADVSLLPPQDQTLYKLSGSSAGLGVVGGAHLGIHF